MMVKALESSTSQGPSLQFTLGDPLLKLLLKITRGNIFFVALLPIVIYGIMFYGLGILITVPSSGKGTPGFLSILDRRELLNGFIEYFLIGSIAWVFYVRDSSRVLQVFRGLLDHGVFEVATSNYPSVNDFLQKQLSTFNKQKRYFILICLATVGTELIWTINATGPQNPANFGYKDAWWHINPFYFWAVYLPLVSLFTYMDWWIFFRRFITIIIINRALSDFKLVPQLFHPDRANGLSPIGQYVTRLSPIVAIYGLWVFTTIAFPAFFGQSVSIGTAGIIFIVEYVIVVPIVLLLPVWKTHQVMSKVRAEALETIAKQIRTQLAATEEEGVVPAEQLALFPNHKPEIKSEELSKHMDSIELLEKKYRLIEKEQYKWPFRRTGVEGYLFTTAIPVVISIVSIIVQIASLHK